MGSIVDSSMAPSPGQPHAGVSPTYHQDSIGDDFGCRYLTAKDGGLIGYLGPSGGCYYNNVTNAVGRAWGAWQGLGVGVGIGQQLKLALRPGHPLSGQASTGPGDWPLGAVCDFRVNRRTWAPLGLTCSPEQTPPPALVNPNGGSKEAPVFKELRKPRGVSLPPAQGLEEEPGVASLRQERFWHLHEKLRPVNTVRMLF